MNRFDKAVRYAAKELDGEGLLRWLFPEAFVHRDFVGWLDTRGLPFPGEPDRICDTVARLDRRDGTRPPVAAVVEFELKPTGKMPARLSDYEIGIHLDLPAHRDPLVRYRLISAVVFLTGSEQSSTWNVGPDDCGDLGLSLSFRSVSMRETSAVEVLGGIAEGAVSRSLLAFVPLMSGADTDVVADEWRRLALMEPEAQRRGTYGGLAKVLADAAGRSEFWTKVLEGWEMTESPVILEWIEVGRAEGRVEGRVEGEIETSRAYIHDVLEIRFGTLPSDLNSLIETQSNVELLREWRQHAKVAESLDAFRTAII